MLYIIIKLTRRIRCFLTGNHDWDSHYYLFHVDGRLPVGEIRRRLIPLCYQYNPFSATYRGQIWTVRRLDQDGIHQYHLRFYYENGRTRVSGHYEMDPTIFPLQHFQGLDLRQLEEQERLKIQWALIRGEL